MYYNFSFTLTPGTSLQAEVESLQQCTHAGIRYFYAGLTREECMRVALWTRGTERQPHPLAEVRSDVFILFAYNEYKETLTAYNDRGGHNTIYFNYNESTGTHYISADIISGGELRPYSVGECLFFHSIKPPQTMYEGVEALPMASFVTVRSGSPERNYLQYWNLPAMFAPKVSNYHRHVQNLQDACLSNIKQTYVSGSGIALSGGIDSGGLLGMMKEYANADIPSFSFGPHGPESNDLLSAKKTAIYHAVTLQELYPGKNSFEHLFNTLPKLPHPIAPDVFLPQSQLFAAAAKAGVPMLYYGNGTQSTLGNLMLNRLWHATWLSDSLLPSTLRQKLYGATASLLGYSQNQREVLLSKDWIKRFLYTQAALYVRERALFPDFQDDFLATLALDCESSMNNDLPLSDQLVIMYLGGWLNYLQQERDMPLIARQFGVKYCCPFNSLAALKVLFKTPDKFRKKNHWNKQLWRDALKPFAPDHLYMRKGKSLVVPYTSLLGDEIDRFLPYLRTHREIGRHLDIDRFEAEFSSMPEPGLLLLRLVSFCVWYDGRHDRPHFELAQEIFEQFDFDYKLMRTWSGKGAP